MDKVGLLRELSRSEAFLKLTREEIRLYILLLICARGKNNNIETFNLNEIRADRKAGFDIKAMMASLSKYGLAKFEGLEGSQLKYRLEGNAIKKRNKNE